jgi:hypothetical protein
MFSLRVTSHEALPRGTLNRSTVMYRLKLAWAGYLAGVRERYKLLMTPGHRGFFMPWLAYIVFVAVTLRWQTDLLLLGVLVVRHCMTPSIARLEHEALYLPVAMALAILIMMVSLIPVQRGYLRAVPMWIAEAFVTLLPFSALLTLIGLGFYWIDLKAACG